MNGLKYRKWNGKPNVDNFGIDPKNIRVCFGMGLEK